MENIGYHIKSSDIRKIDGIVSLDFISCELPLTDFGSDFTFDVIITNPPWCKNAEFISKACEFKKPFVFLFKLDVISRKYFHTIVKTQEWNIIVVPITSSSVGFLNSEGKEMQVGTIGWYIFLPIINGNFHYPMLSYLFIDEAEKA